MKTSAAEILREYGPFPGVDRVGGVTFDGRAGLVCRRRQAERLGSGEREDPALDRCRRSCRHGLRRPAPVPDRRGADPEDRSADRPSARHDPGARRRRRFRPRLGRRDALGRAVSRPEDPSDRSRDRGDPSHASNRNRFVTGVTWVEGELWHGSWEDEASDLRRIDPRTGEVEEISTMPPGVTVSGLESDGGDRFFCGGGSSGKVRAVRRPKRDARRRPDSKRANKRRRHPVRVSTRPPATTIRIFLKRGREGELRTSKPIELDRRKPLLPGENEPSHVRRPCRRGFRAHSRDQALRDVQESPDVRLRIVHESDHLRCSPRAALHDANPDLISMDPVS